MVLITGHVSGRLPLTPLQDTLYFRFSAISLPTLFSFAIIADNI